MGQAWITEAVVTLGYLGIVVVIVIESVFPPVAGAPLAVIGLAVSSGQLSYPGAVTAATAGSLLGALVLYGLGARLGPDRSRRFIVRMRLLRVSDAGVDRAWDWFDRHGSSVVLFGRVVPVVRSLVSIPAGIHRMALPRFVLLSALGSAAWNTSIIGMSATFGSALSRVMAANAAVGLSLLALSAAGVLALLAWRRRAGSGPRRLASERSTRASGADVGECDRDEVVG